MTFDILAPAKINLGLEVLGRRSDGYHDIATVFQTVSVFDRIRIQASSVDRVEVADTCEQIESNLASRAIEVARDAGVSEGAWQISIRKRIPLAAGMGGASSDAAAVLAAIAGETGSTSAAAQEAALRLGSDVPFFLRGGAALAHGRGERLTRLPRLASCWFVIVVPKVHIETKTARLYAALDPGDFSDGARALRVADALRSGRLPAWSDLANAFDRAIATLAPDVETVRRSMEQAGAPFAALTGAGPAHYTIFSDLADASAFMRAMRRFDPDGVRVIVARPTGSSALVRMDRTNTHDDALKGQDLRP